MPIKFTHFLLRKKTPKSIFFLSGNFGAIRTCSLENVQLFCLWTLCLPNSGRFNLLPLDVSSYIFYSHILMSNFTDEVKSKYILFSIIFFFSSSRNWSNVFNFFYLCILLESTLKNGLSWLQLFEFIHDNCSSVCEVASQQNRDLVSRKLTSAYGPVLALNVALGMYCFVC